MLIVKLVSKSILRMQLIKTHKNSHFILTNNSLIQYMLITKRTVADFSLLYIVQNLIYSNVRETLNFYFTFSKLNLERHQ